MAGTLFVILGTAMLASSAIVFPLVTLDVTPSDNVTVPEVQETVAEFYSDNVSDLLEEAGKKITDEDIADYYQQLCDGYGLDEEISAAGSPEQNIITSTIPVENINRTALCSMLEVAGSDIRDEEIAEFYYEFLDKAGWNIDSKD